MQNIKMLIEDYANKLHSAKTDQERGLVLEHYFNEIKAIDTIGNVEKEVLLYLQENLSSNLWKNEQFWLGLALEYPSKTFFSYFFRALMTLNKSIPYWRILDTLVWSVLDTDNYYLEVTKGVKEAILFDNPYWTMDDLKKAFEVLVWINGEDSINFLKKIRHSPSKRLCDMAKYWIEWLEDDEKEE